MANYYAILYSAQFKEPVTFVKVSAKSRAEAIEEAETNDTNIIVLTERETKQLARFVSRKE